MRFGAFILTFLVGFSAFSLHLEHVNEYLFPRGVSSDGFPLGGFSSACFDESTQRLRVLIDAKGYEGHPPRWVELSRTPDGWDVDRTVLLKGVWGGKSILRDLSGSGIDPEGMTCPAEGTFAGKVVVSSEGTFWEGVISEEPSVNVFDMDGVRELQSFVPEELSYAREGTRPNGGPEAITWFRGGLLLGWEDPLVHDEDEGERLGWFWNSSSALIYPGTASLGRTHEATGLTDWVALGDQALLSLERTVWKIGSEYRSNARIFVFDPDRSEKHLVFDFNQAGLFSDNYEGLALGERLPNGTQLLYVVSDDNFSPYQRTVLQTFLLYP